jgi:hypothetical protein
MVTKKAAEEESKTSKTSGAGKQGKRRPGRGDCPIGIGGGNGIFRKGFPIGGITICLPLDENEQDGYKQDSDDSHKYSNKNLELKSFPVVDELQPVTLPPYDLDSKIVIACSDVRTPGSSARVQIIIKAKPLGIKFTGDFVPHGDPGCFHCSYLAIREIYVDKKDPYKSPNGRCTMKGHSV